ncbi:MAG TPA: hypothetical protein VHR66_14495 [Gemmataceae bacterium]|nr:hypothetical protein [Gemmataceae bacterium]
MFSANAKRTENAAPFPVVPVPPELFAWAQQTFDMDEFMKEVREIEETGGVTFESFIAEIEAEALGK